MKKVIILSYYWPPSGGAGVQRWLKLCKYLPENGISPIVITVDPARAGYAVLDESLSKEVSPSTKVYSTDTSEPFGLYRKLSGKKNIPYAGFASDTKPGIFQKLARAIRGNLFIPDARIGWNNYAIRKASELIIAEKIDTVITTSPPHSTQLIGLHLKKEFNVRWIADLRDPWTDIYYYKEFYHLPFARKRDRDYERKVIEQADSIIVASPPWKELFQSKTVRKVSNKIEIITNGYDEEDFVSPAVYSSKEFVITYSGTIADSYDIGVFVHALKELISENKTTLFRLRFVGKMSEGISSMLDSAGFEGIVEKIKEVPHNESVRYLLESSVLLLSIPKTANDEVIIPGKLFEYLASRKPVICIGPPNGASAQILNECHGGRAFGSGMKTELKNYLQSLLNQWKVNPDIYLKETQFVKYSRKNQARIVAGIIQNNSSGSHS